ncbi:MAG TPA: hypothetical protein VMF07_10110 [Solirubrobacteraceae bacterium]|nr:hypothetical protein [Solirubrobacteraceae bacterium]
MIRQRINLRRRTGAFLVRSLTIALALALIYGGVLTVLLALKLRGLGPVQINRISGYRTADHWLAGLHRGDFTTAHALIAGFGGLLVFLFFSVLTVRALPRPYLARTEIGFPVQDRGATVVRPRAIERIAEVAAQGNQHVVGATGRLGDGELNVDIGIDTAPAAAETLSDVRARVRDQLGRHDLPPMPVHVTLTGYEP